MCRVVLFQLLFGSWFSCWSVTKFMKSREFSTWEGYFLTSGVRNRSIGSPHTLTTIFTSVHTLFSRAVSLSSSSLVRSTEEVHISEALQDNSSSKICKIRKIMIFIINKQEIITHVLASFIKALWRLIN